MGGGASRAVSNMPKVSVIVPVFNTAQYLEECLTSILNQSLADIEIICIDDGSKDGSLGILRRFSESDNRIKVLTQENSGAGVARNLGMKHATGTYLSFLDSDDVFEPSMLERLYNLAEERDLDIAVCRCDKFDSMTGKTRPADNSIKAALLPPHGPFAANEIKKDFFEAFIWWPWDKLFRRSFVEDNSLEYMALRTTNDLYYVACNMLLATRIDYVDDVLERMEEGAVLSILFVSAPGGLAGPVYARRARVRQVRELRNGEAPSAAIDHVPVEYVQLVVGHGVDRALYDVGPEEMARSV